MDQIQPVTRKFVTAMIEKVKQDSACRAALRHADNFSTESRAWQYIVHFCKLEYQDERRAFCLVGAAIARAMPDHDGHMSVGSALRSLCTGNTEEALSTELARLRRLLACADSTELIDVIRHVLRYLQTKGTPISYDLVLRDILYWSEYTRINWTKDFFKVTVSDKKE